MKQNILADRQRNLSISLIRLISLILIIMCHMFQYWNIWLAWWFNVGVQIFLCISGFLYGGKRVGDVPSFYRKRFKKILIPYYVTLLIATVCLIIFAPFSFDILRFCAALLCRATIAGGGHLWFVSTILLCYTITPILDSYKENIERASDLWIFAIFGVGFVSILFGVFGGYFNPAWISCYVIGYSLGLNNEKRLINTSFVTILFAGFTVIGNGIQIYLDYAKGFEFDGLLKTAYSYFQNYNHVFLGVFLFLMMESIFKHISLNPLLKFLNITDTYSYECYLVHQFIILGPMSLMTITPVLGLNIVIVLIMICFLARMLKITERFFMGI